MLAAPCYVIADTHIGAAAAAGLDRTLLDFLEARRAEALAGRPPSLLINGDLFEFWYEWRTVVPRPAVRILAALAALHDAGVPVLWIAGNHNCRGGDIIRDDLGADYHVGPWIGTLGGWRTRVEHGDGLRVVEDRRYRVLRNVLLRNPAAIGRSGGCPPTSRPASPSGPPTRAGPPAPAMAALAFAASHSIISPPTTRRSS